MSNRLSRSAWGALPHRLTALPALLCTGLLAACLERAAPKPAEGDSGEAPEGELTLTPDTAAAEEICTGGEDEDGDGLVDCADADCVGAPACQEDCANAADDDLDGLVDCADADCVGAPACQEDCANGSDDDLDGRVDCADADCVGAPACQEDCANGSDDDLDGRVDCADADCVGEAACQEDCANGSDDDLDGLVDCTDPECSEDAACPEDCANAVDDDADGLADCTDPECSEEAACPEDCANGVDDDADGLADCTDPECSEAAACPEDCANGVDDDADGLADCADPECFGDAACPEECANGVDDDYDGLIDCEDADCASAAACTEACGDGVDNDLDGLTDCADDECWPVCMDVSMQVLGATGGGSRRVQRTSTQQHWMDTMYRTTTHWTNSFSMVSGTMTVQRPSSSGVTSCAWTAHGVQVSGDRYFRPASYFQSYDVLSWNIAISRSATSTSGACGVGATWFLPTRLRVDSLGAGSSPSSVAFDISHRGARFAHNWYVMGLPSPSLVGFNQSTPYSSAGMTIQRQTHRFSSSATLAPGSAFVLEDVVMP